MNDFLIFVALLVAVASVTVIYMIICPPKRDSELDRRIKDLLEGRK